MLILYTLMPLVQNKKRNPRSFDRSNYSAHLRMTRNEVFQWSRMNRGFTLIECILGFCILSLVLTCMYNLLIHPIRASSRVQEMDELILNGRFGLEYIKEELRVADKIISSDNILNLNSLYPDNIGFVIFKDSKIENSPERYNFSTYYVKDNNLIRIAINKPTSPYPEAKNFSGHNQVCEGVKKISDSRVEDSNKLIYINIPMGVNEDIFHRYKSCIFLNVEFDY